jgi:hypothetical protein
LPAFSARHLAVCPELLSNFEANAGRVGISDLSLGRFVTLVMPLFLYADDQPQVVTAFLEGNPGSCDFDDFTKLAIHRVRFDKCPLAVWFWCGRHHIPSGLVFSAIDICHAWTRLRRARSLPRWVFIDAPDCWLEAIALDRSDRCLGLRDLILSSGILDFLADSQFSLSHSELSKIYAFKGMPKRTVSEMKADLYAYITDTPNPTIDGFRNEIQRRFRRNCG